MATLYGTIAALQNSPSYKNSPGVGPLDATPATRTLVLECSFDGTQLAGDVVRLFKLPAGCKVITANSKVISTAVGTTTTITVGDMDLNGTILSANRYSTALDVAAAGVDTFVGGVTQDTPYTTIQESWLYATFATLTVPIAGKLTFLVDVNFGH